MKRFLLSGAVAAIVAAAPLVAQAADLGAEPYTAPAAAPAYYDWTGPYVGAHVGYSWAEYDIDGVDRISAFGFDIDGDGFFGGIQGGYNFQYGAWVFGLEADVSFAGIDSDTVVDPVSLNTYDASTDWIGTVRGRVGYAWDSVLLFATGGVAFGDVEVNAVSPLGAFSESNTQVGWTVGGGVEVGLTQNLTVKGEYRYIDLGDDSYLAGFDGPGTGIDADYTSHSVLLGVNYKF